ELGNAFELEMALHGHRLADRLGNRLANRLDRGPRLAHRLHLLLADGFAHVAAFGLADFPILRVTYQPGYHGTALLHLRAAHRPAQCVRDLLVARLLDLLVASGSVFDRLHHRLADRFAHGFFAGRVDRHLDRVL